VENPGLHINIKKVIPVGAGMAGGSTDAACVLRLLNRAFGLPLSDKKLAETALTLGADVPFCLWGGTALAGGVGEKLQPLSPMPDCLLVVGKPSFSVSTKAAFALYDEKPRQACPPSTAVTAALEQGDLKALGAGMFNALEEPVAGQHPAIGQAVRLLEKDGALGARMTGSGSAVFGIFDNEAAAQKAAQDLRRLCREVFVTRPLARRSPGKWEE
jgi:4-diphosphocytidyl-2-C-methyl-D-erythritol kinase